MHCCMIPVRKLFDVKRGVVVSSVELLTYINSNYMTIAGSPRSTLSLAQRDH